MNRGGLRATTELIMRGSLIDESYAFLRAWDFEMSGVAKLANMAHAGFIGAQSESWTRKIVKELRRRFDPAGQDRSLAALAHAGCRLEVWRPLLLWHLSSREVLLRDFLTGWLFDQYSAGALVLRAPDAWRYIDGLYERGFSDRPWSHTTATRVASQLLRFAADFGLMRGKIRREFTSYQLPEPSFLYLLHAMLERQPNAHAVVHSTDWRMFLMDASDVERELFRLHQFRRVHYEVAGSLAQLKLPCESAADYAREMAA